jgi:hypothetical protein
MSPALSLLLIVPLIFAPPALAQGTMQQGATTQPRGSSGRTGPVATQPSNSPFQNPIGQGVHPAASVYNTQKRNLTNVPNPGR